MGLPCRLLLVASAGLAGALDVAAAREDATSAGLAGALDAARAAATRARRVDAIVAAFVADAAAMPLHWIYDTDVLAESRQVLLEFHTLVAQPPLPLVDALLGTLKAV